MRKPNTSVCNKYSWLVAQPYEKVLITCLMAVTVITKNNGRPLVTGLVGVSTITCVGSKRKVSIWKPIMGER